MKRIALAVVLLVSLAVPVWAGFDEGWAAYQRGDFGTALREWQPLAEQGDETAQYNLGIMYKMGQGVPEDDAEAVKWYRLAAEQGYVFAQYNLGIMYSEDEGVPQDSDEALKWNRLAAERGFDRAQNNLGFMYSNGLGVPQDYVQAHLWYNLAAAQDYGLGWENREKVANKMTPAQIIEAHRLAREWKPKME